ncbi:hypothetical protein A9P82_06230 [Arachidicoccus ginsenosidimutans]|uniref:DUF6427 family protein n=1 Tax=Arachidicoccus sp. BS20 TaxID=1850526 RepID=UPI0007F0AFA9|nr:DUF6427 family protein [Arachidicoccus sp. BS20]ANI88926.1 hypothetical protein A9P82_06230 [Arachidicoccus sp. BS20]
MVSLFKEKSSAGVFRLITLSIFVHIRLFFLPSIVAVPDKSNLLYSLMASLQNMPSVFIALIYQALILIQALRLNYLLSNYRLFPNTNFTPAMCFVIFSALLPQWENVSAALIANLFIILLINMLVRLYNSQQPVKSVFNCGLTAGLCALVFPPGIAIVVFGLISVLILRPVKLNELFAYLTGAILPYYFLGSILFLIQGNLKQAVTYLPASNLHWLVPSDKTYFLIAGIAILLCVILGFAYLQNYFGKLVISARKQWIILVLLFVLLALTIPFVKDKDWTSAWFVVIPTASAVAANLFYYSKRKIAVALLFWLLIIACLFNNFDGMSLLRSLTPQKPQIEIKKNTQKHPPNAKKL